MHVSCLSARMGDSLVFTVLLLVLTFIILSYVLFIILKLKDKIRVFFKHSSIYLLFEIEKGRQNVASVDSRSRVLLLCVCI